MEGKSKKIEKLKRKISTKSLKKSSNIRLANLFGISGSETDRTDRSTSRVNTTVFQEVSSKVSGLLGRVFGSKNKEPVCEKVLPTEFLNDLNLQTLPNGQESPRESLGRGDNRRSYTLRNYKD